MNIANKKRNKSGQVLLGVVVVVVIALTIGLSIATRSLAVSARVTRTDTAARLSAVVEGGIERYLNAGDCRLEALSDVTDPDRYKTNCELINLRYEEGIQGCIVDYPPLGYDKISAEAVVTVEKFQYNSSSKSSGDHYRFALTSGQLKEISLYDSNGVYTDDKINVCWDNDKTALYYIAYDDAGMVSKGGYYPIAFYDPLESMRGFVQANAEAKDGFNWCAEIDLSEINPSRKFGLRIRSMYNSANFGVYPSVGDLPEQGYKITAVGNLVEESEQRVVKIMSVYKSRPYMPDVMDYSFFIAD
ncbi:hypothetical protein JXA34_02985 [Patescibacteria group bacterium]|nr:hypothetical protein [Patescibacteria group bacterium]